MLNLVQHLIDLKSLDPEINGSEGYDGVILFVVFIKNLSRPAFFYNFIHLRS